MAKSSSSQQPPDKIGESVSRPHSEAPRAQAPRVQTAHARRQMLADLCRLWGDRLTGNEPAESASPPPSSPTSPNQGDAAQERMSPRLKQTLDLLLAGEGEKQIAAKLGISRHTVHDYVKVVYRRFGVNTRAELLARWVRKP